MQIAASVQPSTISRAIIANTKPKRRRTKPAPKPAAVAVGIQPSPLALRVEKIIRLALDARAPFEHADIVIYVRRRVATLNLSITELLEVANILARIVQDGPSHQPAHEAKRLSPEEASDRLVPRYNVARRVYWQAAFVAMEACISEGARRHLKDRSDIMDRLTLCLFSPGAISPVERPAVIKRLSRDVARMVNNKI